MSRTILLSAALLSALDTAGGAQPNFRSDVEAVVVNVSVRDGSRAVTGLSKSDFELRDNGITQVLSDVTVEELPLDVTFIADVSGSVSARQFDQFREAVERVSGTLRSEDRCSVLSFTRRIEMVLPRSTPPCRLGVARRESTGSDTALFDAILLSVAAARDSTRRQLGILLTDGIENASVASAADLVEAARYSDLVLHVIVTGSSRPGREQSPLWRAQTTFVDSTGGRITTLGPDPDEDIGKAFLNALDEFRSSYVLRYTPRGVQREGFHRLSVKVLKPGRFGVLSRKGYFVGK